MRVLATWFDRFDDWREDTGKIAPGLTDYREVQSDLRRIAAALAASPAPGPTGLDAAWAAAEAALGPNQRLVMWQDHEGPRYIQVLAPEKATDDDGEEVDDVMAPAISILVDYPSKGLGTSPTVELRALAARLTDSGATE